MTEQHCASCVQETLAEALIEVVRALGGSKRVGALMRPARPADEAARWLRDCLNPERRERLEPDEVLFLLREGRRVGCHAAMRYIAEASGYASPVPIEPADEVAELQRQFNASVKSLERITAALEQRGVTLRRAA